MPGAKVFKLNSKGSGWLLISPWVAPSTNEVCFHAGPAFTFSQPRPGTHIGIRSNGIHNSPLHKWNGICISTGKLVKRFKIFQTRNPQIFTLAPAVKLILPWIPTSTNKVGFYAVVIC